MVGGFEPKLSYQDYDRDLPVEIPEEGLDLEKHIQQMERKFLEAALDRADGVRTRAAHLLRMSYRYFRHYAKKYGV